MRSKEKLVLIVTLAVFVMFVSGFAYGDTAGQSESAPTPLVNSGLFLPYVTFATGSCAEAVAIGDLNNDGRNDVVVTTAGYGTDPTNDHCIHVFLQNASGTLESPVKYTAGATGPTSVDIGDLNNDGRNDVVVNAPNCIGVFYQNDTGTFDPMVTYTSAHSSGTNTYKVRIGDFNGDGLLDVVSIDWGTQSYAVDVFLQNLSGILNAPVVYTVQHGGYDDLEVGDVNGDGLTDIIVMSGQGFDSTLGILLQNAEGTFGLAVYYDLTDNSLTDGVAVGDVNDDMRNDVAVTYAGYVGVFYQNASGLLDPSVRYPVYGTLRPVEIGDVNLDGRNDVIAAGDTVLEVLLQNSIGTFQAYEQYTAPHQTFYNLHGLDVGDINGDGANDVVLANCGLGLVVFYNATEIPPVISLSPASLGNTCSQGQNAPGQSFEVWNSGGGSLSYTISDNKNWLSCSPASGTSTGEHDTITVTYSTSSLAAGSYSATITVTDLNASNNPQTIPVSLTVNPAPQTMTFTSRAADDGWVLESTETSNVGGSKNSTNTGAGALRLGDNYGTVTQGERQYKSIVSFDTSAIPDGATITSATLKLRRGGLTGTNPFTTHGACLVDIVTGSFRGNPALQVGDFQAAATATGVATMSNPARNGDFSVGTLNANGLAAINKTGKTQLRIYFALDDNNDLNDDFMKFYSGNNATPANRPVLEVSYQ